MSALAGKRVLVVGLGVSGFAAARALVEVDAKVRVTEGGDSDAIRERAEALVAEGVEVEVGGHDLERLDADLAVLSPGIAPSTPIVRGLRAEGVTLWGEVELAYRLGACKFLAVTGTNGKTTTTSLLASMLKEGGVPSVAAGNIGLPLVEAVARIPESGAIAVEVSSFQLATIERFRPTIAVLLNVAEDHTDWHGSFDDYVAAKSRIVENQTEDDVFLPNHRDGAAMRIAKHTLAEVVPFSGEEPPEGGVGFRDGRLVWKGVEVVAAEDVPLGGFAGLEDAAAAAGAALEFGVDRQAVERAIKGFRPLAHRLELVAEVGGIRFVDDSKATNPHATLSALRGLSDVVLIAGGRSKGIDLAPLRSAAPALRAVLAIGEAAPEVARVFEGVVSVEIAHSMEDAVKRAIDHSKPGVSVLLSPGCASLDMYESYAARGEAFARAVGEEIKRGIAGDTRDG
jgi:UDP-N-acetylmuramoylalanine--D-glutamate ligase